MEQYKQEFIEFFDEYFRRNFRKGRKVAWMLDLRYVYSVDCYKAKVV